MEQNADPCLVQNLKGHRKTVTGLKFHPNEKELVTCSEDNNLMVWNLVSKDVRCFKFSGHTEAVADVDCSSTGKYAATASWDKSIRLWVPSVRGGSAEIKAHTSAVRTVQFSPDDKQLCSGSNDKSVKIWDVARKKFLNSLIGHNNWVHCARYAPDGKNVISCADDKQIKIWDLNSKQCVHTFTNPRGSALKLAAHPNGNSLAAAMATGSVRVYEIRMNKMQQHYVLHDKTTCVSWHPKGTHLLTAGNDGTMRIVDALEARPLYTLHGIGGPILSVAFSVDGEYFACAGTDKNIMVYKTNFIQDETIEPSLFSSTTSESL